MNLWFQSGSLTKLLKRKNNNNNKNYAGGLAFESFFACTSLTEYLSL